VVSVSRTDLLERPLETLPVDANSVELRLHPFELTTLRFATEDSG
jgi:hypothetical protein